MRVEGPGRRAEGLGLGFSVGRIPPPVLGPLVPVRVLPVAPYTRFRVEDLGFRV